MDVPKYLQVLWSSKWLLLVGAVVAAVAAFFTGFTIVNGQVLPRSDQAYTAATTMLVSSPSDDMYQAVIPGQALVQGQTQPETVDLTSKAILYAYLISGIELREQVEAEVGEFADTDSLTAVRRTTQPGGDEAFPGRYVLPIISVVGASLDPERAEDISLVATRIFQDQMVAAQDEASIPDSERVLVELLDEGTASEVEGSNPAIPIVITFIGVFLLFVAAAFVIAGIRSSRKAKRARRASAVADVEPEDDVEGADSVADADGDADVEWRSSRRALRDEDHADDDEPAYTS